MTKSSRANTKKTSEKNKKSAASKSAECGTASRGKKRVGEAQDEESTRSTPRRPASRKKKSGALSGFRLVLYTAVSLVLLTVILFDFDRVQTVAMQPTLYKDDIVVSFAPPFVDLTPVEGHVYLIRSDDDTKTPNFLRILLCGSSHTAAYNEDTIKLDQTAIKRVKLTNDAIIRPSDAPEIWRETLDNGESWRIMLPQNPIRGRLVGSVPLAPDSCFAAGDNRMASYDSRHFGALKRTRIAGHALFILRTEQSDGILGSYIKPL